MMKLMEVAAMNEISGKSYIKATDLNRGKASSCMKKVHDDNCDTIVLKNSEPYVVIISIERYEELLRKSGLEERISVYGEKISQSMEKDD